jgi:DNA-binding NtrC family response regulator
MENLPQFKFFIVEEDIFCANMYNQYLINMNYNDISHYTNGTSCIDNLHQNPDIIFLDHQLEDINGFEVLKIIKRFNFDIYVVIISGQENNKTAVDALRFGAFAYITKGNDVYEKMGLIINKIIAVKEQLKNPYPGFIKH